jgi:hypothetical protein
MAIAATAVGYSAHKIGTRYSNEEIFKRERIQIEQIYRTHTPPIQMARRNDQRQKSDVEAAKAAKYRDLKATLGELSRKKASGEERCRCEENFREELRTGSKEAAAIAIERASYEPYADCKPANQLASGWGMLGGIGILVFLGNAIGLIRSFGRRKEPSGGGTQSMGRVEKERTKALKRFGFPPERAHSISRSGVNAMSVEELSGLSPASEVLDRFLAYGFPKNDVSSIVRGDPTVLNIPAAAIHAAFLDMENSRGMSPAEVRAEVAFNPACLHTVQKSP